MLDSIIKAAKAGIGQQLSENGVAPNQMDGVLALAKDTVLGDFKSAAKKGDIGSVLNLFNGNQSIQGNSFVNNIISDYAGKLVSKMGFSASAGKAIAGIAIPFIMNLINDKTPKSGLPGNDLSALLGNSVLGGVKGNLMGKLGKLFS